MLFENNIIDFELQSVRQVAIFVDFSTQSELDAISHEVEWHCEGIEELFDMPILDLLSSKVKRGKLAALVVLQ